MKSVKKQILEHIEKLTDRTWDDRDSSEQEKTWEIEDVVEIGVHEYHICGYICRSYLYIPGSFDTPPDEQDSEGWHGEVTVIKYRDEEEVETFKIWGSEGA